MNPTLTCVRCPPRGRTPPLRRLGGRSDMKIALDPYMIRHVALSELPAAVAALGYDQIELSPARTSWTGGSCRAITDCP